MTRIDVVVRQRLIHVLKSWIVLKLTICKSFDLSASSLLTTSYLEPMYAIPKIKHYNWLKLDM